MYRGPDAEQKSDIITATPGARGLMRDDDGLIPVPAQSESYFVVDCPSLHIVSGNLIIGPRRQSETDVSLNFHISAILLSEITYAAYDSMASQCLTMPSVPDASKSLPELDRSLPHPESLHQVLTLL
jgi:hypothetical protein